MFSSQSNSWKINLKIFFYYSHACSYLEVNVIWNVSAVTALLVNYSDAETRKVHVANLLTAGAVGADSKQFGLVVGDQGSCPGTHTRQITFGDPPGPQTPSLSAPRQQSLIFSLTTAGKRLDEPIKMSGI